jgi:hypothetical protein
MERLHSLVQGHETEILPVDQVQIDLDEVQEEALKDHMGAMGMHYLFKVRLHRIDGSPHLDLSVQEPVEPFFEALQLFEEFAVHLGREEEAGIAKDLFIVEMRARKTHPSYMRKSPRATFFSPGVPAPPLKPDAALGITFTLSQDMMYGNRVLEALVAALIAAEDIHPLVKVFHLALHGLSNTRKGRHIPKLPKGVQIHLVQIPASFGSLGRFQDHRKGRKPPIVQQEVKEPSA